MIAFANSIAEGSTTLWTGSLGGGKTLGAMSVAMEKMSMGATCITNVETFATEDPTGRGRTIQNWMRDEYGLVYDPARFIQLKQSSIRNFQEMAVRGNDRNPVVMVLDESALDLNARDWASLNRDTFNFVVLARKLGIELHFIAQNAADLDKQIRLKMQREIHCRSLMNLPFVGRVKLPIFIQVTYVLSVGSKPWRTGVNVRWKGTAWGYFDSKALHGEKAQQFAQLAVSTAAPLQRVPSDPLAPWAAVAAGAAGALVSML
jgi:hypothetical protein